MSVAASAAPAMPKNWLRISYMWLRFDAPPMPVSLALFGHEGMSKRAGWILGGGC